MLLVDDRVAIAMHSKPDFFECKHEKRLFVKNESYAAGLVKRDTTDVESTTFANVEL
jgi:hypothetical protein